MRKADVDYYTCFLKMALRGVEWLSQWHSWAGTTAGSGISPGLPNSKAHVPASHTTSCSKLGTSKGWSDQQNKVSVDELGVCKLLTGWLGGAATTLGPVKLAGK